MPKRHYISEDEVEAIRKVQKANKDKNIDKWLEVLLPHAGGEKRIEIVKQTGFAQDHISKLVGEYKRVGLEEYARKQYKGNHRNMSYSDEEALLKPFMVQAQAGQIVEVGEILAAYEKAIGRKAASNSQIYYVLARHGWRKIMPRSKHPNKASDEVIDASKKLTLGCGN